jgi:hypothetical protein
MRIRPRDKRQHGSEAARVEGVLGGWRRKGGRPQVRRLDATDSYCGLYDENPLLWGFFLLPKLRASVAECVTC